MFRYIFFFQAEDGIRDLIVTGVQTCALPICTGRAGRLTRASRRAASASISSVLQNANRTSRRPSSGRLKKLEPGTGATPISFVSQKENASSARSETAEQSART